MLLKVQAVITERAFMSRDSKYRTVPPQNWVCSFAFSLHQQKNFLLPAAALASPTCGTPPHAGALHFLGSTHYVLERGIRTRERVEKISKISINMKNIQNQAVSH